MAWPFWISDQPDSGHTSKDSERRGNRRTAAAVRNLILCLVKKETVLLSLDHRRLTGHRPAIALPLNIDLGAVILF